MGHQKYPLAEKEATTLKAKKVKRKAATLTKLCRTGKAAKENTTKLDEEILGHFKDGGDVRQTTRSFLKW